MLVSKISHKNIQFMDGLKKSPLEKFTSVSSNNSVSVTIG